MSLEYEQNSPSVERTKTLKELKQMNQPNSTEPNLPTQPVTPIVIQCPLPEALTSLTRQMNEVCWELEEIRKVLPGLKTYIDLMAVQNSLTESQKSLAQINRLLEQAGKKNAKRTCKWLDWLPDFYFLTPVKWIALILVLIAAVLAVWYGAATVLSNVRSLLS